jgi:hypothetical protein
VLIGPTTDERVTITTPPLVIAGGTNRILARTAALQE